MTTREILRALDADLPTTKTAKQIANEYGIPYDRLKDVLWQEGFRPGFDYTRGKRVTDWERIDWSLNDQTLADMLNCHRTTVTKNRKRYAPTTK